MDELRTLQDMGLSLPSPAYLAGLGLFGLIGLVAWTSGRRQARPTRRWLGLALMLYPYAIDRTWLLWAVGAALVAALVLDQQRQE